MPNFILSRGRSMSMVVLVLLLIMVLQGSISYSTTFGRLEGYIANLNNKPVLTGWFVLRILIMVAILVLWFLNRKRDLFRTIILFNAILTLGLIFNMTILIIVLLGFSSQAVKSLLVDVILMAVTNILIFSILGTIIDPPGVEESQREDEPWDFLFPQRGNNLPHYEFLAAEIHGLPVPGVYRQFLIQPNRHATAEPARKMADAPSGYHLDHHSDWYCRQRYQHPGGKG